MDYKKFREVADEVGALLMCDMAHVSGLVAADLMASPFEFCDLVTTTVHKTLRGPRSGILFYRRSTALEPKLQDKVEKAIFPGLLGGPHNHTIAAMAACFKEASSEQFREYQKKVLANSQVLGESMVEGGYIQQTGGTDNHMILVSIREQGLFGDSVEHLLDLLGVTLNKFQVKGTPPSGRPNGLRLGSPPMTTRGCTQDDFFEIGKIMCEILDFAKRYSGKEEPFVEFKERLARDLEADALPEMKVLSKRVKDFASKFPYNFKSDMI